jgi:alkylation response protein AidB-like acyl-CoA dehydrogenase
MEFRLDDEQIALQQTAAKFCADRFSLDSIASRERVPTDRRTWKEMASLGMFALLLPEDGGGSSRLGPVEAMLLLEQFGKHLATGPMLWTVLAAGLVEDANHGEHMIGGVLADEVLDDGSVVVEHATEIDTLVVLHHDGVVVHRTADLVRPDPLEPFDPLTSVGRFQQLPDRSSGRVVGDANTAHELRALGTVLASALLVGVASRALDVARDYALEREQFGVPIGSFQAVKHLLADMYVRRSLAQSAAYAAAALVQESGRDDPSVAVAGAKLLAGEAAIRNASTAVQVLGGMGFTWEMLPNYLLKRAWVLEQSFGAADAHAFHIGTRLVGASQ